MNFIPGRIRYSNYLVFIIPLFALLSCTSSVRYSNTENGQSGNENQNGDIPYGAIYKGIASYYHDKFNGRKTANGEIFDNEKFTAAHKELPFNTRLMVKNLSNGKTVIVRVNDRGPFVRGRIIDLSKAAAREIGMIRQGVAEVEIKVLQD